MTLVPQEEQAAFEASVAQKRKETEERARKNAEKRKRKKMKKMGKLGGAPSSSSHEDGQSDSEGEAAGKEGGGEDGKKPSIYEVPVTIKNDGSFLETVKKMLAEKSKEDTAGASGGDKGKEAGDQPA